MYSMHRETNRPSRLFPSYLYPPAQPPEASLAKGGKTPGLPGDVRHFLWKQKVARSRPPPKAERRKCAESSAPARCRPSVAQDVRQKFWRDSSSKKDGLRHGLWRGPRRSPQPPEASLAKGGGEGGLKGTAGMLAGLHFLILLISLLSLGSVPAAAQDVPKDDVIARYEKAVAWIEELNVYQEDVFHILPKVRLAGNALYQDDLEQADRMLKEALEDLELLESKRSKRLFDRRQREWLEIYVDIFQKLVLLGLLAYFFVSWPFFNRRLHANRFTWMERFYLTLLVVGLCLFFSVLDYIRYGVSAWAFFELPVVLITIGGLLGGLATGIVSGLSVGVFRWILKGEFAEYFWMLLGVGALSGILSVRIKDFKSSKMVAFVAGALVGLIHGVIVYFPMRDLMLLPYFFATLAFLALIEGGGALIFFAGVSGVLREQERRQVQQELLKTQLLFLQAQVNPHFLYNALNSIGEICDEEKAPRAKSLVIKVAEFFRRTMKRVDDKVTLKEEMAHVDAYIEIEKTRFEERLKVEKQFDIPHGLWEVKIPVLILQPLVENAIKHGIGKNASGGTLRMKIYEEDSVLKVEISDDGVGMGKGLMAELLNGDLQSKRRGGIGIQNINQRLVQLWGSQYCLRFDSERGVGTKVTVSIPVG